MLKHEDIIIDSNYTELIVKSQINYLNYQLKQGWRVQPPLIFSNLEFEDSNKDKNYKKIIVIRIVKDDR